MIGLAFELIEWSIKLMVLMVIVAFRLMVWAAKVMALLVAGLIAFIGSERRRRAA